MIPAPIRKLFVVIVVCYFALGGVFVAQTYAGAYPRMGPSFDTTPVVKVPTGSDDRTVEAYYDYLYLRTLQQQGQTFEVLTQPLLLTYAVIGAVILIFVGLVWAWFGKRTHNSAGLYPVEVYNGYITERNGPVDTYTYANYAVMLAFCVFYIWWNLVFGQWM